MLEGYVKKDSLFVDERMGDSYPDIYVGATVEESSVYATYTGAFDGFNWTLFHCIGTAEEIADFSNSSYKLVDVNAETKKIRYYRVIFDHEEDISDLEMAINEEEHAQA